MSESWKVAVVGSGPAGCAAAWSLARAQIEVVLFERGYPGKDKACGDAFLPSAIELLRGIGIDDECIKSLGGYPFQQIDLWGRDSLLWSTKQAVDGTGWIIPRAVLDQKLRDQTMRHAGFEYGTRVVDVMPETGSTLRLSLQQSGLSRESTYDAVVLAGGSGDPLSRKWGTSGKPIMGAALSCYVSRPRPRALLFQLIEEIRPGYGWIFPTHQESVNIGVCSLSQMNTKKLRQAASRYLTAWNISASVRWRGGGGPVWSGQGTRWHHPAGIVSCGDAAGIVNPATGEGITAALLSGAQAGMAVGRYLQEGRALACLEDYTGWVRTHFDDAYHKGHLRRFWGMLGGLYLGEDSQKR